MVANFWSRKGCHFLARWADWGRRAEAARARLDAVRANMEAQVRARAMAARALGLSQAAATRRLAWSSGCARPRQAEGVETTGSVTLCVWELATCRGTAQLRNSSNNAAQCMDTRFIHRAVLLFALQPTRNRGLLGSWRLALDERATDLSSRRALGCRMAPQSRALPEDTAVAPPSELLSTRARQCSHVAFISATSTQAQLHA